MAEKSRWADIYVFLTENGYDVYAPEQKEDECKKPYIVIKDSGSTKVWNISSNTRVYDIMCYVPKDKFSDLEPMVEEVKGVMDGLFPTIRPVNFETPSFYNNMVKAHTISIRYENYKKNRR